MIFSESWKLSEIALGCIMDLSATGEDGRVRALSAHQDEKLKRLETFLVWFRKHCTGDEKGEGQLFFNYLFQAFGNAGVKEAGATCEERVKKKKGGTGFADLVWRPRVIIELKKRGTPLQKHYEQAFEYWLTLVPNRPQFMALCNFDEFWIYDLNTQLNDPVHVLKTENLLADWGALAFLFPKAEKPIFNNNNVEVTEAAAKIVGSIYLSLASRKVEPERAQRFVLQLVVALFAEDVGLIPQYTLQKILKEAVKTPVLQRDLTSLFKAMATDKASSKPPKFKEIPYFNGGLFTKVEPVELTFKELDLLAEASEQNWSKVRPSVFGSIFESSMDPAHRHGHGIHYTSELDIQKIVNPTIVRPFRERITKAKTKKDYAKILHDIQSFKVLDPACGSGNFLYVAFREIRRLEVEVMELMEKNPAQMKFGWLSPKNFYGIDTNRFGLELAKIALSIGRKLAADELGLPDNVLPFEDLDGNFSSEDALLSDWPGTDVIIGNPPYLGSRYLAKEHGYDYVKTLSARFPNVPKMADYCTHWFRVAHDRLSPGGRAGLVGTNTIRQNESREASLDYIIQNGGTITDAVSTQVWSGDAAVHVSIVNWVKGEQPGKKAIYTQLGDRVDSPWKKEEVSKIPASLSAAIDVGQAKELKTNQEPKVVFVGQYPFHDGFLLSPKEAAEWIRKDRSLSKILFPYMIGRDLLEAGGPTRWIIDFGQTDQLYAMKFDRAFKHVKERVMPTVLEKAKKEKAATGKESTRWTRMANRWWQFRDWQPGTMAAIATVPRYIAVSRVTKRPIFEFVDSRIHPDNAVVIFPFADDYSFGVLQSGLHGKWFQARCSSLKGDSRYTSETVFDTFPWPQCPTLKQVRAIADAAVALRKLRNKFMGENQWSLRDLYRSLDTPGKNPLRDAQDVLDEAVHSAYGFDQTEILGQLLQLNCDLAAQEESGKKVVGPGLPQCIKDRKAFITDDCISIEGGE